MSQAEAVSMLQQESNVEHGFSSLVWLKLEEQNPEFFRQAVPYPHVPPGAGRSGFFTNAIFDDSNAGCTTHNCA